MCRWVLQNFRDIGSRLVFFFLIFRIRHLGSLSRCYAWRFGLIFCRQAKNNVQLGSAISFFQFSEFGPRGIFFRPGHVPGRVVRGLGIFSPGCWGDLESLSAGALARWGGPGDSGNFFSFAGHADRSFSPCYTWNSDRISLQAG